MSKQQIAVDLDELSYSSEYADYIMENAPGDRVICSGDTLLDAMESGYLWDEFIDSLQLSK
jgi:hypothetical protein